MVPGSIRRDRGGAAGRFRGQRRRQAVPVTYRGIVPDTFTDANDIEVIVEGRLGSRRRLPRHRSARQVRLPLRGRARQGRQGLIEAPDVTLLGKFALWLGAPRRDLGRRRRVLPAAGRAVPTSRARDAIGLRRVRRRWSSRRWRSGRASSRTTSTSSTSGRTPRGTCPTRYMFAAFWAGQKGSLLFWARRPLALRRAGAGDAPAGATRPAALRRRGHERRSSRSS